MGPAPMVYPCTLRALGSTGVRRGAFRSVLAFGSFLGAFSFLGGFSLVSFTTLP